MEGNRFTNKYRPGCKEAALVLTQPSSAPWALIEDFTQAGHSAGTSRFVGLNVKRKKREATLQLILNDAGLHQECIESMPQKGL